MCGISGFINYESGAAEVNRHFLDAIHRRLLRRGPDGEGVWFSENNRVALAHRRLAILDLSENGAQPMASANGQQIISFNGEIYNFQELRRVLIAHGHHFRSDSDTEVLLALYQEHGIEMVSKLRGMFSFALWDNNLCRLFLTRDSFGIKPLYYHDTGSNFYFSSQVKALLPTLDSLDRLDETAICSFYLMGSVPEPRTVFKDIRAVEPGSIVEIGLGQRPRFRKYQSLSEIVNTDFLHSEAPENSIEEALEQSVAAHLVSDAPCGFFLSAGLDSSLIVACARQHASSRISVTLGFEELRGTSNDETKLAELTAKTFRTDHQTHWISRYDFEAEVHNFFEAMDQPTIDGINSYFVSYAAKKAGLTVALSGLGADELFQGYPSFRNIPQVLSWTSWCKHLPWAGPVSRKILTPFAHRLEKPKYASTLEYGWSLKRAYFLRRALFLPWELEKIVDAEILNSGLEQALSEILVEDTSLNKLPSNLQISILELSQYMRNQLLRDTDWASMYHSIEVRVPFVDRKLLQSVVQYSKLGKPPSKLDLATYLSKFLPDEITKRPKTGFIVPMYSWLTNSSENKLAQGYRSWADIVLKRYLDTCKIECQESVQYPERSSNATPEQHV